MPIEEGLSTSFSASKCLITLKQNNKAVVEWPITDDAGVSVDPDISVARMEFVTLTDDKGKPALDKEGKIRKVPRVLEIIPWDEIRHIGFEYVSLVPANLDAN